MHTTIPLCKVKSKRSGKQCCNFALKGKSVCRMHGGKSTGARTVEGKIRLRKANFKHGMYPPESIEEMREFKAMIKQH